MSSSSSWWSRIIIYDIIWNTNPAATDRAADGWQSAVVHPRLRNRDTRRNVSAISIIIICVRTDLYIYCACVCMCSARVILLPKPSLSLYIYIYDYDDDRLIGLPRISCFSINEHKLIVLLLYPRIQFASLLLSRSAVDRYCKNLIRLLYKYYYTTIIIIYTIIIA